MLDVRAGAAWGYGELSHSDLAQVFWQRHALWAPDEPARAAVLALAAASECPREFATAVGAMHVEDAEANCFTSVRSNATAKAWFRRGAEAGDVEAMFSFYLQMASELPTSVAGFRSGQGREVGDDERDEAIKWLQKSAAGGKLDAIFMLALTYAGGTFGVPKDEALLRKWVDLAAARGHEDAQAMRDRGYTLPPE